MMRKRMNRGQRMVEMANELNTELNIEVETSPKQATISKVFAELQNVPIIADDNEEIGFIKMNQNFCIMEDNIVQEIVTDISVIPGIELNCVNYNQEGVEGLKLTDTETLIPEQVQDGAEETDIRILESSVIAHSIRIIDRHVEIEEGNITNIFTNHSNEAVITNPVQTLEIMQPENTNIGTDMIKQTGIENVLGTIGGPTITESDITNVGTDVLDISAITPTNELVERNGETDALEETNSEDEALSNFVSLPGSSTHSEMTKRGTVRKRKLHSVSLRDRKKQKKDVHILKHSVLLACEPSCSKKCIQKIDEERRKIINEQYWSLTWKEQKMFVLHNTSRKDVARRQKKSEDNSYKKNQTFQYTLRDRNESIQIVCKTFFLTTLGFKKSSDWVVNSLYRSFPENTKHIQDRRGRKPSKKRLPREDVHTHIMSFNPSISHYRREHAPNRLYLPSDITVATMFEEFQKKYPSYECSYDFYRSEVKKMNISFTKLGNEQCERCEEYSFHNKDHTVKTLAENCEICTLWKTHLDNVKYTRSAYKNDVRIAEESSLEKDVLFVSVDLQKVIMLPRIDVFKRVLFTKRITAYNESFVPLGNQKKHLPMAALWHEGLAGRNQEELVSAFSVFLRENRDVKHFIIWADNCTGQLKNWTFISFLIYIMNRQEISAEKIHVKYFEPGHSYMSADSFHHQVELSLKRQGKTYDFKDFIKAVESCNDKRAFARPLTPQDFGNWRNCTSLAKINKLNPRPYIRQISEMIFLKNKTTLKYRTFTDESFFEIDVLQEKYRKKIELMQVTARTEPTGINKDKKETIIRDLVPLMPDNRKPFWLEMPTN